MTRPAIPDCEAATDQDSLPPFSHAAQWPRAAMREGQWRVAAERWALLRQVYPQEPIAWIEAVSCLQQCGADGAAASLLHAALDTFPQNAFVAAAQVRHCLTCDNLAQAEALAASARHRFPQNPHVLLASAQVFQQADRAQEALDCNEWARTLYPQNPDAWTQHAELAMSAEDWPLALERWAEVRTRFPQLPAGFMRAAVAAERSGDERLARQLRAAREFGDEWLQSVCNSPRPPADAVQGSRDHSLFAFVDLVLTKARMNLKSEASQNYLRYLWWLIDPLMYMFVFYVFFGMIMQRGDDNFLAFLLTGLVPFQWFAKTVQQAANSIVAGKGLMYQVRLTPLFFPLVSIAQNLSKQLLVFVMLAGFLMAIGLPPSVYWLGFLPVFVVNFVFIVAASCLVAMIVPFIRDVAFLVPTALQFLLFCSGVFIPLEAIPEAWRMTFLANPVANILYQYRCIFVYQRWPSWEPLGWLAVGVAVALVLILLGYRRLRSTVPRVVLE